jgi:antitoxin component YwqK of YwqJK toxin-antitoxin module
MMTEYDKEGNIITKGEYIEGRRNGEWYFKVGLAEIKGIYSDDMRSGLWRYWDLPKSMGKEKTLRFEGRFIEDNPHGEHTWYWDNGNRKDQGEYVMGRKEGNWIYYNYDGTPFLVVSYENGFERKYDGFRIEESFVGSE